MVSVDETQGHLQNSSQEAHHASDDEEAPKTGALEKHYEKKTIDYYETNYLVYACLYNKITQNKNPTAQGQCQYDLLSYINICYIKLY